MDVAARIREARTGGGLSQGQLARRARTSQSRLSTYENGTVTPSADTLERILAAARPLPSVALHRHRVDVLVLAERYGLTNVRVFGSVARGEDHTRSDIDLLVTARPSTSLLELSGFAQDAEVLLGCRVDVTTDAGLDPGSTIAREALVL